MSKTILVLEGGGMRGAFEGGACAALEEMGQTFDLIIAVSVGICSGMYLSSGQARIGGRVWIELVHGNQFIKRSAVGFPRLDVRYLISCFRDRIPLQVTKLSTQGTLLVLVTDLQRGQALYIPAQPDESIWALIAGCIAIPPFVPSQNWNGTKIADGGLVNSLPVRYALELGGTEITVVTTHPKGWRMGKWQPRLAALVAPFGYPRTQLAHADRAARHNAALELIDNPPPGVVVRGIYPPDNPPMSRFTTAKDIVHAWFCAGWKNTYATFGKNAPALSL